MASHGRGDHAHSDASLLELGDAGAGVERRLESVPASVPAARRFVADLLATEDLPGDGRDDLLLAVSEAVTNVVRHAYHGAPGTIELTVRGSADHITIVVTDHGHGLGAMSPSPGLGLGLGLIRRVADHVTFPPVPDGGTAVEMRFRRRA